MNIGLSEIDIHSFIRLGEPYSRFTTFNDLYPYFRSHQRAGRHSSRSHSGFVGNIANSRSSVANIRVSFHISGPGATRAAHRHSYAITRYLYCTYVCAVDLYFYRSGCADFEWVCSNVFFDKADYVEYAPPPSRIKLFHIHRRSLSVKQYWILCGCALTWFREGGSHNS